MKCRTYCAALFLWNDYYKAERTVMKKHKVFVKLKKRALLAVCILALCTGVLSGCDKDPGMVVFNTGFGKNELFKIGSEICTKQEYMVYLTTIQNQYEQVFGEEIWKVTAQQINFEDNMKDTVLARIAQMKTMYLLAVEKGIELSDTEESQAGNAAHEYFSGLSKEEIRELDIKEEDIVKLYRENALADKVYSTIIEGVNPEISDDEARTLTIEYIVIRTYTQDGTGKRIDYTGNVKQTCLDNITRAQKLANEVDMDFAKLSEQYSDDQEYVISFRKGEVDPVIEEAAYNLEKDQVSEILENQEGYYLIKCISSFDREQTDANKVKIIEERKNQAFSGEYDAFVDTLPRDRNDELWAEISMLHDDKITTTNFFDVYDKYFPK